MGGKNQILQWNLNGLRSRLPRLQYLVNEYQPKILALQEHKLSDIKFNYFSRFNIYSFCRPVAGGGGVSLAVSHELPSSQIQLQTNLEAVACKIYFNNFCLHVCNIYFNAEADITVNSLTDLLNSIPSPRLILGDFNAKHRAWGSPGNDRRGEVVNDVFFNNFLHLLNDGSPTYYRSFQDQYSHLDLTFCSNTIGHRFKWEVYNDQMSSDHFPIFISCDISGLYVTKSPKWKLSEANWPLYKRNISIPDQILNINNYNSSIIKAINDSCSAAIPKTSSRVSSKYCCFWWTPACKVALSNAKRQFRILQRFWCPANVAEHRRLEAIATRTLLDAKSTNF